MLTRLAAALAAAWIAALAGEMPALAQGDGADLPKAMREFAEAASGMPIGILNGPPADKILMFGRDEKGEIVVTGIGAVARGGDWPEPSPEAIALMRTRSSGSGNKKGPKPADIAFVQRVDVPVFILGEWSKPPVMWEIALGGGQVRWREIGADGRPGPWRTPAPAAGAN